MILKITSPTGVDYRQIVFFFISKDKLTVQYVAANGQTTTLQGTEVIDHHTAHAFDMYTDEMHILDSVNIQLPLDVPGETPPEQSKSTGAVPEAMLPVMDDGIGQPEGEA